MKETNLLLLITIYFLCGVPNLKAQESNPNGYYGSIYGLFVFMASNHPDLVADGFFDYSLNGFFTTGVEVGKYFGKNNLHISLSKGFSTLPESIEDYDVEPMDGEIELQNSFAIAMNYRQQISKIKQIDKIIVNIGSRVSTMYYRYSGVKAIRQDDRDGGPPTYTFDNYGMNTVGIEAAPYLEIGKHAPGKKGIFLNWEFLSIRLTYKGAGLGLQKVAIILKF